LEELPNARPSPTAPAIEKFRRIRHVFDNGNGAFQQIDDRNRNADSCYAKYEKVQTAAEELASDDLSHRFGLPFILKSILSTISMPFAARSAPLRERP
jgi:hypothetical protein